jgi:2-phospho-L-lactate guanylyltransferase
MSGDGDLWSLLVPVKRLDLAKTRLGLADRVRAELALAMAIDTVTAAINTPSVGEVVVITDDERAAKALASVGARVVDDQPDAGLNPALVHGASMAAMTRVASLSSDLPALKSEDLEAVLRAAGDHPRIVVSDVSGTGTTLLAAMRIEGFQPAFGEGSLAAHVASGAIDVSDHAGLTLRQDVDTIEALRAAVDLGVGEQTTRAVAGLAD